MEYRTAIIVDWENIRKRVFENPQLRRETRCRIDYNQSVERLPKFFLEFLEDKELPYRIFIYTAKPFDREVTKPDGTRVNFSNTPVAEKARTFMERIGCCDLVAVRKGRVSFKGWTAEKIEITGNNCSCENIKPVFIQKKVDMLIGLDIAHLAYKKLVDRILIFSYDLDIQPALRIARLEGLQVILPILQELGTNKIPKELVEHSDFIRIRKYRQLCNSINSP